MLSGSAHRALQEYQLLDWTIATRSVGAGPRDSFEYLDVMFRVARKPGFYFWKALLPLYFLTVFSLAPFVFGEAPPPCQAALACRPPLSVPLLA